MSEIVPRRRRWPYVVVLLILVVGGFPFAWRYRPLNSTERRLVGGWSSPAPDEPPQMGYKPSKMLHFFKADRTYVSLLESRLMEPPDSAKVIRERAGMGTWYCSGSTLTLLPEFPDETDWSTPVDRLFELVLRERPKEELPLKFDDSGDVLLEDVRWTSEKR